MLFDIAPVLDEHLFRQTVQTFLSVVNQPSFPNQPWLRRTLPPFGQEPWDGYLQALGFSYHAPYPKWVPSLAGSADVATCTQVLYYVPASAMAGCIDQVRQTLKPGGLFLATIHLRDAFVDGVQPGLPKYLPLQYSPGTWERWINSSLMFPVGPPPLHAPSPTACPMNWYVKVAAYKLLSTVPGGRSLYRFTQEHLTKSLTSTRNRVNGKVEVAAQYVDWLTHHQQLDRLLKGVHLDFGSGWHPTIPLFFYAAGVERQYLFDVVPHLDENLVRQTIQTFLSIANQPQLPQRAWLRRNPPPFEHGSWQDYLRGLGISYHAPYAHALPSLAASADVATCTQVLYYVPESGMPMCIDQVRQTLKPGGLFLATVHLRDAFAANVQPGLPKYLPLQYSRETWERWINSSLMSFNRLKAPDYRGLLEQAGFEILHFEVEPGTEADLKELDQVPIADCFKHYSREDLAARHLFFVARKR